MLEIKFYDLGTVDENLYKRVVIISQYKGKWVYCRHKERNTWEIPGGHIEEGESALDAAKRELYEETGAVKFDIEPICVYSISQYAVLFYANIYVFDDLPEFEIRDIAFFDDQPEDLTYADAHSKMFDKFKEIKIKE